MWDVLRSCVRAGSLDTSIMRGSEVPNDLAGVVADSSSLRAIAFNGGKAAGTFRRIVLEELPHADAERVTLLNLPSTSPANATWSLPDLVRAWSVILRYLDAPLE